MSMKLIIKFRANFQFPFLIDCAVTKKWTFSLIEKKFFFCFLKDRFNSEKSSKYHQKRSFLNGIRIENEKLKYIPIDTSLKWLRFLIFRRTSSFTNIDDGNFLKKNKYFFLAHYNNEHCSSKRKKREN